MGPTVDRADGEEHPDQLKVYRPGSVQSRVREDEHATDIEP